MKGPGTERRGRRGAVRRAAAAALLLLLAGCAEEAAVRREPKLPPGWRAHKVERGETLYRIAKRYGLSVDEVARANGLEDPTKIEVGRRLRIPPGRPEAGAPPPPASPKPDIVVGAEEEPRPAPTPSPPPPVPAEPGTPEEEPKPEGPGKYAGRFVWPVNGYKLLSGFGMRQGAMHNGLDLGAPEGTPIRAAADGTVIYEGDGLSGYGNMVILDHGGGYTTIYAHNDANKVALGKKVKQGQVIATVGDTGRATAPHCHFEIRKKTRALNPLDYLP